MKCLTVPILIIILVLSGYRLYSQNSSSYLVRKVSLKNVPIDADFSSLQQDNDGFLWLGGLSGLYRYDGSRITRFLRDPADSNSLTHNYANTLSKDSAGNIWVGTFGGFMNKFDRVSCKIMRIEPNVKSQARTVVLKTKPALDGNIIAATAQALFKITIAGVVTDSMLIPPGLSMHITDFLEYHNDKFLVTATNGLFLFDYKNKTVSPASSLSAGKRINCIERDDEGFFWLGGDSDLVILNQDFSLPGKKKYNGLLQLHNNKISCIQKDVAGRIWIGTNKGLFIADHDSIQKINSGKADSLKTVNELFIDNKGMVWVCAAENGLYQIYQPGIVFKTIPGIEIRSGKILIQSILEERAGVWLIGTKAGLYRYIFISKEFEEVNLINKNNKIWIGAQLIDKNKGYWVGSFGQGVFYRPPRSNEFIQFTNHQQNGDSLPFNTVAALAEDNNGNIWMGTFNDGVKSNGICYYDPVTKRINRISGAAGAKTFKAIDISQIEMDNQHQIWIGTWDMGLHHYYGKGIATQQNTFTDYTEASAGPQRISHNVVSCIKPGRNGKIWFGTISGGINVLDTKTDSVYWFTIKDGLPSNLVYRIEEDDQGILWISTDNGIARFDPDTKSFINYNTSSGLPANNFAFLTSEKCKDGTIAFGTNDGQVVYFNPNTSRNSGNTLPVVITDIKLFNKSLETGFASLLKKAAYLTDTLRLKYEHSVISFELANMDFQNPEIYNYAYKLEGFDKGWSYTSDNNGLTYTNLNPGTYTLLIKNANHLGIWNPNPTRLVLMIEPPYWQTWWFVLLIVSAVAALIFILFRYRLQQKLRILQVRNRLHRDLHDDVGATLSSVKAYSEILRDNPDNPVIAELIKDNSTEMLERLEIISWATNPQHDNFKSLKSTMIKFAAPLCHATNIQWTIETGNVNEEMMMPGEVRQNIFLVFKEAVNNMIKYAEATTFNTTIFIKNNLFVLRITDNGKGFDGTAKGTGNGRRNMQKRTADLHGKLIIDSTPGKGTIIIMSLPYPFKIPSSWGRN
jgi:ligand-binding sensor domain-containing protein